MSTILVIGTEKGAWIARSDKSRSKWKVDGPIFKGWKVTAATRDRKRWLLGVASQVYGATIQASDDLKEWRQLPKGPAYAEGGKRKLTQIWRIHADDGRVLAGVDEAGLFGSGDRGETWSPFDGLNEHPTRDAWQPGNGGLCAHSILTDPKNPQRMWCGISAVGVWRTDDGGKTWRAKNEGVPIILEDKTHKDIGY